MLASDSSVFPPGLITGFFKGHRSQGDPDHDGIRNSENTDDHNDGILDVNDDRPFVSNSSSAAPRLDNRGRNEKECHERGVAVTPLMNS